MNKIIKNNFKVLTASLLATVSYFMLFVVGFAQVFGTILTSINDFKGIVNALIAVVIALAFLFFFYNLATFIMTSDKEKKENSLSKIGYSIIGIFVIVSIWGIVGFIGGAIGIDREDGGGTIALPTLEQ